VGSSFANGTVMATNVTLVLTATPNDDDSGVACSNQAGITSTWWGPALQSKLLGGTYDDH
jgi:hypothetical protein